LNEKREEGPMGKREKGNPHLKQAMLEVVDNQLRDNNPPETRQTYERLMREGHSEEKAKELIAAAVIIETYHIMKAREVFNLKRFVGMLEALPELPEDE
jgi:hypothetical protein